MPVYAFFHDGITVGVGVVAEFYVTDRRASQPSDEFETEEQEDNDGEVAGYHRR